LTRGQGCNAADACLRADYAGDTLASGSDAGSRMRVRKGGRIYPWLVVLFASKKLATSSVSLKEAMEGERSDMDGKMWYEDDEGQVEDNK
jgi:hypothetical protein